MTNSVVGRCSQGVFGEFGYHLPKAWGLLFGAGGSCLMVVFYRSSVYRVYLPGRLSNKAIAPSKDATDAMVFWVVLPSVDDLCPLIKRRFLVGKIENLCSYIPSWKNIKQELREESKADKNYIS
ncbi:MAG: hypothetical protein ACE5R6_10205 [Candidatus Heimdallarchaeota archaeon]